MWRRKRSADGRPISEQSADSIACFEESSRLNSDGCPIMDELPLSEQTNSALSLSFSEPTPGEAELFNFRANIHLQNEPFETSRNISNQDNESCLDSSSDVDSIICKDDSYTSDSECLSSSDTDYSSTGPSDTEPSTSSDESDLEELQDESITGSADSGKFLGEKEKLSLLILSYIARYKLSGSASADLLDLLKLITPGDNTLQSLVLSEIKETLGDCILNVYDYCGKCFSIFPKDENIYQCNTTDGGGNQCTGLRYRGNAYNQPKKRRNLYFVTVSGTAVDQTFGT